MKVFVSSVRRGLEEERDALPGLIQAMGHQATRFEDFTAQPVPSRAACLAGVEDADAYLLLLGTSYGDPLTDTGLSPTEEEYNVALRRGIPRLVFRKRDVEPDPNQRQFVERVEAYPTGLFRASFGDTSELLTEVVRAIREVAAAATPLRWEPLPNELTPTWRREPSNAGSWGDPLATSAIELHLLPNPPGTARRSASDLASAADKLTVVGRDTGLFPQTAGVQADAQAGDSVSVVAAGDRRTGALSAGLRISRDGNVMAWQQLPTDTLGTILDRGDLAQRLAALLHAATPLLGEASSVAIAAALEPLHLPTEGNAAELGRRSSASLGFGNTNAVYLPADDAVTVGALAAADEIGGEVAQRLLVAFRSRNR
jgi:hypothetical protein